MQTPRPRGLQRPSYGGTNHSPSLGASTSAAVNRKASYQALTGQAAPTTPSAHDDGDLQVGDIVNVPGNMYGEVKFVGSVRGKAGTFVGVELDRPFAAKGKNSGDVDGLSYFTTSVPGAGVFLPMHRAELRLSPSASDTSPLMPNTPSYSTLNGQRLRTTNNRTPPSAAPPHRFAQSVGPGARPSSPSFKPSRPSLPRPESPLRRQPPNLAPTPGRAFSQSQFGVRPGQTPSKTNLRASTMGRPPANQTPRPYSRSGSRLGMRAGDNTIVEDEGGPVGVAATSNGRITSTSFSQPLRASRSPSRLGSAGGADAELQRLRTQLAERDRRLDEQAASLADMESSVKELSALIAAEPEPAASRPSLGEHDDASAAQLRQVVREKNEKISLLTAEFDAHRADFRSTLDSLEMASSETERVYEEQKRDLLARVAELEDASGSREDFEAVASQLKQLEELVAELEEGLEESRRGEAEARGEVEFLRGEVERGRSELRRERDKAAASTSGSAALHPADRGPSVPARELEQRDDEIRGLKAIIHGLSGANGSAGDGAEVQRLQAALDEAQHGREHLERELEQLRRERAPTNGDAVPPLRARAETQHTATATNVNSPSKASILTDRVRRANDAMPSATTTRTTANGALFCDMCEATDHDTLDCSRIHSERDDEGYSDSGAGDGVDALASGSHDRYGVGDVDKENEAVNGAAKGTAVQDTDADKWCALCEKDGHLAFDCPDEQY